MNGLPRHNSALISRTKRDGCLAISFFISDTASSKDVFQDCRTAIG